MEHLDLLDNVERVLFEDEQALEMVPIYHVKRFFERIDPFTAYNDREFRLNFRLSKESVIELTRLIAPHLKPQRNYREFTPLEMVCLTLSNLGGDEFQRTSGRLVRCDQGTVTRVLDQTLDAINTLKPDYIRFPTQREAAESAQLIKDRFGLDRFAYGIDGVHMIFNGMPRNAPVHTDHFLNRKMRYSLNVMVIADAYHRILDLDLRYPGCAHDAKIWRDSSAQTYLKGQPWYLAGDAGYPLSPVLIKPFLNPVNRQQRLFNARLSGARTVMTENVYGIWKKRFPVMTNLRFHHAKAMKAVLATAILHNYAISRNDTDVEDFEELPFFDEDDDFPVVEDYRSPEQVRRAGEQVRNQIVATMPGPRSARERRI